MCNQSQPDISAGGCWNRPMSRTSLSERMPAAKRRVAGMGNGATKTTLRTGTSAESARIMAENSGALVKSAPQRLNQRAASLAK